MRIHTLLICIPKPPIKYVGFVFFSSIKDYIFLLSFNWKLTLNIFILILNLGCTTSLLWQRAFSSRSMQAPLVEHRLQSAPAQWLRCVGALGVACSLSCSAVCGILVPWPGIKILSSALKGRFLTPGPPGTSLHFYKWMNFYYKSQVWEEPWFCDRQN